jgi:glutamine amidotransferase
MCRFLAYRGEPIFLSDLVCAASHSLVRQSLFAEEGKTGTNGDGFGLSWYGERPQAALYREAGPAWSDENLQALCHHIRSRLFFAHIRASTGASTTRANCHPFAHDNWLFMHNGQVGGYPQIKRDMEAMIPDRLYGSRIGSSDSEAIFLAALANGLSNDPIAAMVRTLRAVHGLMIDAGIAAPLRFTAAVTDGQTVFGLRWASDNRPPSLYYRETSANLVLASEPVDGYKENWREVPKSCSFVAKPGRPISLKYLEDLEVKAAA